MNMLNKNFKRLSSYQPTYAKKGILKENDQLIRRLRGLIETFDESNIELAKMLADSQGFDLNKWAETEYNRFIYTLEHAIFENYNSIAGNTIFERLISFSQRKTIEFSDYKYISNFDMYMISKNKNITELEFDNCNIQHIPEEFSNLQNLERLTISQGNLSTIPTVIGTLESLNYLKLSMVGLKTVRGILSNLNNLLDLDIYGNELSEFPDNLPNGLEFISVVDNKITKVPDSIGSLTNLEHIYMNGNRITELPESIGNLNKLEYLSIGGSPIKFLPKSFKNLNLQDLYIKGTNITVDHLKEVFGEKLESISIFK